MGHARVYTAADALARFHRLCAHRQSERSSSTHPCTSRDGGVLFPIGWDAFGLPAENAARQNGISPAAWTAANIAQLQAQFGQLNISFTSTSLCTANADYYRWTQEVFRRLYRRGLVYREMANVNWDPIDETVLADEQVDASGRSWRSGAVVEKRMLAQWYVRITALGAALEEGLVARLAAWPEPVRAMQRCWIGRQEGRLADDGSHFAIGGAAVEDDEPVIADQVVAEQLSVRFDPEAPLVHLHNRPIPVRRTVGRVEEGQTTSLFRMRDWLVSRQRYWGCPIPVIHCDACHEHELDDETVDLPQDISVDQWSIFRNNPNARLGALYDWYVAVPPCSKCHGTRHRELDTLDTFFDSSWYFLRFLSPTNTTVPVDLRLIRPVDVYFGGIEHAILHLLYARFIAKVIAEDDAFEPFTRLVTQGLVMAKTYKCTRTGAYLPSPSTRQAGEYTVAWEKMSKSKQNGVNPAVLIEGYGSDVVRVAILFKAPLEAHMNWEEGDIRGAHRWITRLLSLPSKASHHSGPDHHHHQQNQQQQEIVDRTIEGVTRELEACSFNTAIALLMTLTNAIYDKPTVQAVRALAVMLYPFAPFTAAELYAQCHSASEEREGGCRDVRMAAWPVKRLSTDAEEPLKTIVVQRDGRKIGTIEIGASADEGVVVEKARGLLAEGATFCDAIYVPGRVVNFSTVPRTKAI